MNLELTILMPCLNEARTVGRCVTQALRFLQENGIHGEVVVADNGSTDGSREICERLGARVVPVRIRGYGAALGAGIEAARGKFVIMGDSDESYDFSALLPFVEKLRAGYDLVMGNRFKGGIAPGAMPFLHRYFGNPLLTAIGRLFFHCTASGDFYCGIRGFRKTSIQTLGLQSTGMEFALEMIVKAGMNGLRITEVPATLSPDGRDRAPHLRRYRDGWRSLRFYLLMSPRWFFAVPGSILTVGGLGLMALLLNGPLTVFSVNFDYHTLLYAVAAVIVGYQALILSVIAKLMAVETGLHPPFTRLSWLTHRSTFERSLLLGLGFAGIGIALGLCATWDWSRVGFGDLHPTKTIRLVATSVLFLVVGGQTALAGCFLGLINLLSDRRAARNLVALPNPTSAPGSKPMGVNSV
ncbi:MAG TPA: glycosyltransferase family 2 protein [Opitutaceae bacterium]|nr:glycosyltransferase family 2 protein [Opitutaceae bacterium]